MSVLPVIVSWVTTFEDAGHRVLGLSWQNRAEAANKLWRTKVNNQLPQTSTDETNNLNKNCERFLALLAVLSI